MQEAVTNSAKIHSLARNNEHLRINQIYNIARIFA